LYLFYFLINKNNNINFKIRKMMDKIFFIYIKLVHSKIKYNHINYFYLYKFTINNQYFIIKFN
jgi:hypothetical protein